jgi:hypothetical protein
MQQKLLNMARKEVSAGQRRAALEILRVALKYGRTPEYDETARYVQAIIANSGTNRE